MNTCLLFSAYLHSAIPCAFGFLSSPEFYVIAFVAAAAIIALMARPSGSAPAVEHLLSSSLLTAGEASKLSTADPESPSIEIICDADGSAMLFRHGLQCMNATGAVSAKVEIRGFNITIYERLVAPRVNSLLPNTDIADGASLPTPSALFQLDFLIPERYYLRYESEAHSSAATLSFRATEGYHAGPASLRQ